MVGYRWSVTQTKTASLGKDEADSLYHCPIQECDHAGFQSQRGRRKHVNTMHSWFFFFDEKPNSKEIDFAMENTIKIKQLKPQSIRLSYSLVCIIVYIGEVFNEMVDWKWWRLQERPRSSTNSEKMLKVSEILLRRRGRVDF